MSIDLKKLEHKLDEALSNETNETLTKFLTNKRMSNNKQSSVEWYDNEIGKLFKQFTVDKITIYEFRNQQLKLKNQAKAMHKEEVTSFTADWSVQYKYEDGKSINKYYNETFGGNK